MNNLPPSYDQLVNDSLEMSNAISPLMIYPRNELEKLNQAYKVDEFAHGAVIVGSDGGGEAIVLDMREDSQTKGGFYFIPFIPLDWKEAKFAGNTLEEIKAKYNEMWGK